MTVFFNSHLLPCFSMNDIYEMAYIYTRQRPRKAEDETAGNIQEEIKKRIIGLVPPGVQQNGRNNPSERLKLLTMVLSHLPFGVELFVAKSPGKHINT